MPCDRIQQAIGLLFDSHAAGIPPGGRDSTCREIDLRAICPQRVKSSVAVMNS
jgi:hypothetical protein